MSQANTKTTRHRVLIVDDEESMRLLLARILVNGLKVEVTLAGHLRAGVAPRGQLRL